MQALQCHPNGRQIVNGLTRPNRSDDNVFQDVFPNSDVGKLLQGLTVMYLIKQEHRMGWARKSACDDTTPLTHPNETVASHQWGVATLVMTISRELKFQQELPNFDILKAIEMALIHDVPELVTGDITPVDGVSPEEKHKRERAAIKFILSRFSEHVGQSLEHVYDNYESRQCIESKFVKDCDKLDFLIQAFLLERQGFTNFSEFYTNVIIHEDFFTNIANDLAQTLVKTRNELFEQGQLYKRQ